MDNQCTPQGNPKTKVNARKVGSKRAIEVVKILESNGLGKIVKIGVKMDCQTGQNLKSNGLRKVVKSWGSKVAEIGVKKCAGRKFRPTSGQVPEILRVYPGVTASQITRFRKLGGTRAEVPLGRKFRCLEPEVPVWGNFWRSGAIFLRGS
jgi:hypothetical protein